MLTEATLWPERASCGLIFTGHAIGERQRISRVPTHLGHTLGPISSVGAQWGSPLAWRSMCVCVYVCVCVCVCVRTACVCV